MINELFLLSAGIVAITCLLCILLGYLIIRKVSEINHYKKVEKINREIQPTLFAYLLGDGPYPDLQTDKKELKQAIEELLLHVSKIMEQEAVNKRMTILAESHLKTIYQQNLYKRNWSIRMNTLYFIETFRMKGLLDHVMCIFEKEKTSVQEKIQALRVLAVLHYPKIDTYLYNADFLSDSEYRSILLRLDQRQWDQMVLAFDQSNQQLKFALLDAISIKNELKYTSLVEHVFDFSEGEQKIRAYKTLVNLGYMETPEKFISYAHSSIWEVRMLTAKFFGITKNEKFLPELLSLIKDPVWWVRFQAGQAIALMPNGNKRLNELLKSQDPFARDMAWEWLNKGDIQ